MVNPLEPLLADGVIDEVLSRLKSGKEADLWLVRHGQEVVAAKVYKSRQTRSFKNNSAYLEGRRTRNSRTQRAMDRGSKFGQAAAEEAWKTKEADALHALHAAGVRVPRPVLFYEGVLLMEVVVDAAGHPAPRLIDAEVAQEQAAALYADLRSQVVKMLCCDLVHGDLSPYNVLLGWDGPVVIDFPQVVGAAHNSQAEGFFFRDLANLRHYFEAIDPGIKAFAGDGREIWRAYTRRELEPDFVPPPPRPGAAPQVDPRELPPQERPAQPQRSGGAGRPAHQQRAPQQQRAHQGARQPVQQGQRPDRPPQQPQRPVQPGRQPQPQPPAQPPRLPGQDRPQRPPQQQPQRSPQPGRQPQQQRADRPNAQAQGAPQRQPQGQPNTLQRTVQASAPQRQPQGQPQRAVQPPRSPGQDRPQRPSGPGGQQRRPGGGGQPRGPIVERRPVLGAQGAAATTSAFEATAAAGPSPGQGRKRRRRRGGRGGSGGGGGAAPE